MLPFLIAAAVASIVGEPPEGARTVTLLLCPEPATCSDETFWLTHLPDLEQTPIVLVDNLLAMNAARQANNTGRSIQFRDALLAARGAVTAQDWSAATFALDEVERALDGWTGSPTNQELFDIHYLRAVIAQARHIDAADSLSAAAAVAWNRTVTLPVPDEATATAYYAALADVIHGGTGSLHLDAGPVGTVYFLDGIELGPGPLDLQAFPGAHRLTAFHPSSTQEWRATVTLQAGRTVRARARLSLAEDEAWVTAALNRALEDRQVDPEIGDLLRGWCERFGLKTVQLVRAAPASTDNPDPLSAFTLHAVTYDPMVRRFIR